MVPRSLRRRVGRHGLLVLGVVGLVYLGTVLARSWSAYFEDGGRGWAGKVYEPDATLGFRMIPGARGAETMPIGPDVPARVDLDGFRVPMDADEGAPRTRPLVLALGCSFTYGAACRAEDTFPFLVANGLHGTCLNAGVCSYGLSQMLVRARDLIPRFKPDYVLFQHSPWLVARSRERYARTYLGLLPKPTFVDLDGECTLEPPLFQTVIFDLPLERYLRAERDAPGFLSFGWRVGLPLFLHDDVHRLWATLRGSDEPPAPEAEIVASTHAEVEKLCGENGSRLVYVLLDSTCPAAPVTDMSEAEGILADASSALCAALPAQPGLEPWQAHLLRYGHWAGDPPQLVDDHPNPVAHAIIADTILAAIRGGR